MKKDPIFFQLTKFHEFFNVYTNYVFSILSPFLSQYWILMLLLCSILVILSISIVGIIITNLRFDLIVPKIELNSIPCYDKK